MIVIYGLVCPFTNDIRYIGKTEQRIEKRLSAHITEASQGSKQSHKHRWIRKCLNAGMRPRIVCLEQVAQGTRWQERERAWIAKAAEIGLSLTNQTSGGEGLDFSDPQQKAKYIAKLSASMKALQLRRPDIQEARTAGSKRSWSENRQARIDSIREAAARPEVKAALAAVMAEVRSRPGYREERSNHARQVWVEHRDKLMEAFSRPETKAKHSARINRCWSDPVIRDRLMNRWTPQAREKQRQAVLAPDRQAKIAAAMTPQSRARQGAKMKEHWANLTPAERAAIAAKSQANKTPEGKARHSAMMKERWARYRSEKAARQEDEKCKSPP